MFKGSFAGKLMLLSMSMLLLGFFIGYGYTQINDNSSKASYQKEGNEAKMQFLISTPTPENTSNEILNDE